MLDLQNVYAYLKRIELGAAVEKVAQLSPMSMNSGTDAAMPARLFSDEAAVMYLVDHPTNLIYVQEHDLAAAGISEDELHALGVANLERLLANMQINEANGAMFFSGSGTFEASMLLVPSLWDTHLAGRFPNGPVASIAARDILAVCDRENSTGLEVLRNASRTLWERGGDHLLARELYERTPEGTWVPFETADVAATAGAPPPAACRPQDAPPAQPSSVSRPQDAVEPVVPTTRVEDVGLEQIVISNTDLGGELDTDQLAAMFASGYRWNPDSQCFHRVFVGEPGAPERPWTTSGWPGQQSTQQPKRGFFRRRG